MRIEYLETWAEPIADALAVTFTTILFAIRFKKILGKIEKQKD